MFTTTCILRWEDFEIVQEELKLPDHNLLKHVSSRWLTLATSAKRFLEQLPALKKYFLRWIPKYDPDLMKSKKYKSVASYLQKTTVEPELLFVISVAELFNEFTRFFQLQTSLIHILHERLMHLVNVIVNRVCKVGLNDPNRTLNNVFDDENLKPVNEITIEENVLEKLKKLPAEVQTNFKKKIRTFYVVSCSYVLKKCDFSTLKKFSCISPDKIKTEESELDIVEVAKCLPLGIRTDVLVDEWKLLQAERPKFERSKGQTIVEFWKPFFEAKYSCGEPKFPNITKVLKCCFTLSHGNADVEGSFSESSKVLTSDKTRMCVRTLNARMNIKEEVKLYDNKPEKVPITKKLLSMSKQAYKSYQNYLDEEKRIQEAIDKKKQELKKLKMKEEERRKKAEEQLCTIKTLQNQLVESQKTLGEKRKTYEEIFAMGAKKLKRATEKQSFAEISVAQELLKSAENLKKEEKEIAQKTNSIQDKLNKLVNSALESSSTK